MKIEKKHQKVFEEKITMLQNKSVDRLGLGLGFGQVYIVVIIISLQWEKRYRRQARDLEVM